MALMKKTPATSDQGVPLQTVVQRAPICFEPLLPAHPGPEPPVPWAPRPPPVH